MFAFQFFFQRRAVHVKKKSVFPVQFRNGEFRYRAVLPRQEVFPYRFSGLPFHQRDRNFFRNPAFIGAEHVFNPEFPRIRIMREIEIKGADRSGCNGPAQFPRRDRPGILKRYELFSRRVFQGKGKLEIRAGVPRQTGVKTDIRRFPRVQLNLLLLPGVGHMVVGQQNGEAELPPLRCRVPDGKSHVDVFQKGILVPAECESGIFPGKDDAHVSSVELSGDGGEDKRTHPAAADADSPRRSRNSALEKRQGKFHFDCPVSVPFRLAEFHPAPAPVRFLRLSARQRIEIRVAGRIHQQMVIDSRRRIRSGINEKLRNVFKTGLHPLALFACDQAPVLRQFRFQRKIERLSVRADESPCAPPFQSASVMLPHAVERERFLPFSGGNLSVQQRRFPHDGGGKVQVSAGGAERRCRQNAQSGHCDFVHETSFPCFHFSLHG